MRPVITIREIYDAYQPDHVGPPSEAETDEYYINSIRDQGDSFFELLIEELTEEDVETDTLVNRLFEINGQLQRVAEKLMKNLAERYSACRHKQNGK